jgi:small subunit ribosomal protein S20
LPAKAVPKKSKSVLKRARQTKKITLRNRSLKKTLKTLSKKVETAIANKNMEGAKTALNKLIPAIDSAATKRIIHKNTASRRVSRFTKLVNSLRLSGAV